MAKVKIPTFKLNNGRDIPALGYGTWLGLDDKMEFISSDGEKMKEALSYAVDIGYRHIDTAHLYRVEPEVGEVVRQKIEAGVVGRDELFITTKVWQHNHKPEDVVKSIEASLKRMQLDYLDLVLMHWPMSISQEGVDEKIDYVESWRGFETALDRGLTKSIGVSNFNVDQLKRLINNCRVAPVVNQVEINLTLGQEDLVSYCKSQNIVVVAYSPFGAMVPSRAYEGTPSLRFDDPTMVNIAKKYNKTASQIVLRYLYQRGVVSIPKTVTKSRVLENASIFDFELEATDVATIAAFDVNFRLVRPVFWEGYANYPFDVKGVKMDIPQSLLKWKNGINGDVE